MPATWRDLNELRYLEHTCFPLDAWTFLDLIGVLTFPSVVRLKAVDGEMMVGFIAGDQRGSKKLAWIATLGVLPDYRRQGIGTVLLQACEGALTVPRIRLSVRAKNATAITLYRKRGYQRIGLWPNYYHGGMDAVILEKQRII
ncbi:MAG: GNAT family N-acetyltransferase [Chloroflexi bacterium]|nr:GNAT family N-acetyltransferase [Chloroflexota bacterium]